MSYVHLYCGDGKGKTTAALGLGLRCCGSGGRVLLAQFLKGSGSSELNGIEKLEGFVVLPGPAQVKFTFQMTEEERREAAGFWLSFFRRAVSQAVEGGYRLLILDELAGGVSLGRVPEEEAAAFLKNRPEELEVVLTGRNPSEALLARGDYVTRMEAVRHPYEKGIGAREGVEY